MKINLKELVKERQSTINEKLGLTYEEYLFIADGKNGAILDTDFLNCQLSLLTKLYDLSEYNQLDIKYGIDITKLVGKVSKWSYEKCLILIHEIEMYWDDNFDEVSMPRFGGGKNPMEALRMYLLDKK